MSNPDPLTAVTSDRFVLFPIQHHDVWDMYKNAFSVLWTAEEINLSQDPQDWKKLSRDEQHFLSHVLAFFAASDGIVNENLACKFYGEFTAPEIRMFYGLQILMEGVHSETYSLLLNSYITDEEKKTTLFNAVNTVPAVASKANWALKWMGSDEDLAHRLVAFACVEGIFFSSSFCSIYWVKTFKKGLLPGLAFSNELIARDEGLHTDFAVLVHSKMATKCPKDDITRIVTEAVDIEIQFATESLPVALIGMNSDRMIQYIKYVADRLLVQFGCKPVYTVKCPFDFMLQLGLQNKTNIHEHKLAEYRRPGVGLHSSNSFSSSGEF